MGSIAGGIGQASILALQSFLVELNGLSTRAVDPGFAYLPAPARKQLARNRQKRVRYHELVSGTVCGICASGKKLERHHIIPPRLGGTNARENIMWVCHGCHITIHGGK